jgi:Fe2+ or Zn2+ uptake regulation protein
LKIIFNKDDQMDLQTKLNQKGFRLTQPRRVVMEILDSAPAPLSPQTIYQNSMEKGEEVGLVTVYRTLELLMDLHMVRRVHGHGGCHGYVSASPGHFHHIVCQECGKAVEFNGASDLSALVNRIQQQTGFIIDGHLLQLQGICPDCQKERYSDEKR